MQYLVKDTSRKNRYVIYEDKPLRFTVYRNLLHIIGNIDENSMAMSKFGSVEECLSYPQYKVLIIDEKIDINNYPELLI